MIWLTWRQSRAQVADFRDSDAIVRNAQTEPARFDLQCNLDAGRAGMFDGIAQALLSQVIDVITGLGGEQQRRRLLR